MKKKIPIILVCIILLTTCFSGCMESEMVITVDKVNFIPSSVMKEPKLEIYHDNGTLPLLIYYDAGYTSYFKIGHTYKVQLSLGLGEETYSIVSIEEIYQQ